nr:ZO1 [Euperipatoides kanangrensis]
MANKRRDTAIRRVDSKVARNSIGSERSVWEFHNVTLMRVPGYGFGIAVSGGRDNPHFSNGDPAIVISDVLKAGPAEGKLFINDRVISANGLSLENVDYATAVNVLRDSGNIAHLVVKRKVVLPSNTTESQTMKVTLTKNKKKEDFGLVLGCRLFIKEITSKTLAESKGGIQQGDTIVKINNTPIEQLSLSEAKKLLEKSKEKLQLVLRRDVPDRPLSFPQSLQQQQQHQRWPSQNLYVESPIPFKNEGGSELHVLEIGEDKPNNLSRMTGRRRGPLMDVSLTQLDQPSTPILYNRSSNNIMDNAPPPRPPPPTHHEAPPSNFNQRRSIDENLPSLRQRAPAHFCSLTTSNVNQLQDSLIPVCCVYRPDPRYISFKKEGSVGIRLCGGNEAGIFVAAVQPGSPAALQGLTPGDKLLKVNNKDMRCVTREDAVLFLLGLQDQIDLMVQHRQEEYDRVVTGQTGDSFYIRSHFNYEHPNKGEMTLRSGDIFLVKDTLHNGVVGAWQVVRIGRNNQETQKGTIPNMIRAQELAKTQHANGSTTPTKESRGSFFKRRSARRTKSLNKEYWDEVVFADSESKYSAYERVVLQRPGFIRPVVLFGPLADVAKDKLLKDLPDKFASPQVENESSKHKHGIVRLSAIQQIIDMDKHCILDVTPNAVDRLNYAQFYPIVIYLRAENKHAVKELRQRYAKSSHKSSKKLYDTAQMLEKTYAHLFTAIIPLTNADSWYRKVKETVDKQLQEFIWMSETKPEEAITDDFLFPMTSRLSYASSPESDLDLIYDSSRPVSMLETREHSPLMERRRLVKASSDPSINTAEEVTSIPNYNAPPAYTVMGYHQSEVVNMDPKSRSYFESDLKEQQQSRLGQASTSYGAKPKTPPKGEIPPYVDRSSKPDKIKTIQEKLFGTHARLDTRDPINNYVNTNGHTDWDKDKSPYGRQAAEQQGSTHIPPQPDGGRFPGDLYPHYASHLTNAHDDLKSGERFIGSGGVVQLNRPLHDPYRNTRSTVQSVKPVIMEKPKLLDISNKQRNPDSFSISPKHSPSKSFHDHYSRQQKLADIAGQAHKLGTDLIVKGKLDSPGYHSSDLNEYSHQSSYYTNKGFSIVKPSLMNIENKSPPSSHYNDDDDDTIAFDSGKDTLDRSTLESRRRSKDSYYRDKDSATMKYDNSLKKYETYSPGRTFYQYQSRDLGYHTQEPSGLDLSNRESRGSAFELYKKPSDSGSPQGHLISDLSINEGGTPSPVDENHIVVATAKGIFDHNGGTLTSEETGVSIVIPKGAIGEGVKQQIYFKVCQDNSILPPLDKEKGETLLSPLVMCGPHGLKFLQPVELHLPHCASATPDNRSFALKSSEDVKGHPEHWQNVTLAGIDGVKKGHVGSNSVSVLVDHF